MTDRIYNIQNTLSIIIPVYNEAGVIEKVIDGFYEKVVKKIPGVKFIIAEDGSTDGTREILNRINKKVPFTLIINKERKGYTTAFKDALRIADTELVFFSDSDGQHDPEDIFKLLKEIGSSDIVSGYKSPRRDPVYRAILSKIYNFLFYLLFGLKTRDINSGFKLIKRQVIGVILGQVTTMEYCAMSEFILRAHLAGYKISEVPVTHHRRKSGETSIFGFRKLPFIIARIARDLFKIKLDLLKNQHRA